MRSPPQIQGGKGEVLVATLWITDNAAGPVRDAVVECPPKSTAGDFSVMALLVDRLADAVALLQDRTDRTASGLPPQVRFSDASDLAGVILLLREYGIHATVSDIAGGFYQG
jgi:hypothetical protein